MKKLIILVSFLVLSGCAHEAPYVPPPGSPDATIQFVNLAKGIPTTVVFYEDGLACQGMHRLSFFNENYASSSIRVQANKPLAFSVSYNTFRTVCSQTYMFTPGEADYRVRMIANDAKCALAVERRMSSANGIPDWVEIHDLVKRRFKAPFFESGKWCRPLSK